MADLPTDRIGPSPLHLRRGKDKAADAELLLSVKAHGILEPVMVRPCASGHPLDYEVVFGHRRLTAAKAAKLATIPAIVRDLTDLEALELQVIENQHRQDVHPLEEAEGYRLMTEQHGLTVEDVAAKVGKSKAYVYGRLKLAALGKAGRKAFLDGHLEASTALLVARIPAELQEQALEEILGAGDAMSYREAADYVQRTYMLRLAGAPFDPKDLTLVPAAGACGACPNRTGNQPDLFSDVTSTDVCTDPPCFARKRAAAIAARRAVLEEKGLTILPDGKARRIFKYNSHSPDRGSGYTALDEQVWVKNKQVSVKALLAKHGQDAQTVHCLRPDGHFVKLVPDLELRGVMAKADPNKPKERSNRGNSALQKKRDERERALARASRALVLEKASGAKDATLWLFLAPHVMRNTGISDEMKKRMGLKSFVHGDALLKACVRYIGNDVKLARDVVLELTLEDDYRALKDAVRVFKIKPDAAKRRANAELAAAAEAEKQKRAAAKKTGGKKAAKLPIAKEADPDDDVVDDVDLEEEKG